MGFPETFAVPDADGPAEAVAHYYRQIGNAVVPPVVEAIGAMLVARLELVVVDGSGFERSLS